MEPWQERVIAERDALVDKLVKLGCFLHTPQFHVLPGEDKQLLRRQREAMLDYCDVLDERIARFKDSDPCPTA